MNQVKTNRLLLRVAAHCKLLFLNLSRSLGRVTTQFVCRQISSSHNMQRLVIVGVAAQKQ